MIPFDNYECPGCGYLIDKAIYEYGMKKNIEAKCLCGTPVSKYNLVPANTESPFLKGMWIKYPEGFDIMINGVTLQYRPKPRSPAHQ